MDESKMFDFDKMTDEELKSVGSKVEKFKPINKESIEPKMPGKEAFGLGGETEKEPRMPEEGKFKATKKEAEPSEKKETETSEKKEVEPSEKKETETSEKKEVEPSEKKDAPEEKDSSKDKKDMTITELGDKIETLLSEDAKIRSEFDSLDSTHKKEAVNRLGEILKEYNELVELINTKVSEISISETEAESMTQDDIVSELKSLRSKNTKLRNMYEKAKNDEVKVAIENQIDKLNYRYSSLVDAYNNKNSITK